MSAPVAGIVGAVMGAVWFWIVGVYSRTLGSWQLVMSVGKVTLAVSFGFAFFGFGVGPYVGTAFGHTIAGIFAFERVENHYIPTWLKVLVLAGMAVGMWRVFT